MQIATTSTGHITRVFDDFLKMSKITKFFGFRASYGIRRKFGGDIGSDSGTRVMIGEKLDFPAWFYGPQGGVFALFNTVAAFGRRPDTFGCDRSWLFGFSSHLQYKSDVEIKELRSQPLQLF